MTPRCYEELKPNGVTLITTFVDDEIRWSVVKDGHILFNQALAGKYSLRKALVIGREQERIAEEAAR